MGSQPRGEASAWALALVRAVGTLRQEAGLTHEELYQRAGMSRSYYYLRLRGDAAFDANDFEKFGEALGTHPHEISRLAAALAGDVDEPTVVVDRGELARRLRELANSPSASGEPFDQAVLLDMLAERGVAAPAEEWAELIQPTRNSEVKIRVLDAIAGYMGVPRAYVADLDDAEALEVAEAQIDFRRAVRDSGAHAVAARAVGDVSPTALRAIARSIRAIGSV